MQPGEIRQKHPAKKMKHANNTVDPALYAAVFNNDVEKTAYLLENGANPSSLLHLSVKNNNVDISILLISYGADVNETDKRDHLPLFYAAANGNVLMIECLMNEGTELTQKECQAALSVALFNNHPAAVLKLIEYGVDPNIYLSPLASHSFLNKMKQQHIQPKQSEQTNQLTLCPKK